MRMEGNLNSSGGRSPPLPESVFGQLNQPHLSRSALLPWTLTLPLLPVVFCSSPSEQGFPSRELAWA